MLRSEELFLSLSLPAKVEISQALLLEGGQTHASNIRFNL